MHEHRGLTAAARGERERKVTKGTISLMSRDYVRLKKGTEGGETERRRRRGAPPDCRAYGYKRRQESERRRVINLAVFHVSRRGRALLMETSFDLHPRCSSPRSAFAPLRRRRRRRHRPFSCSTLPVWFPSDDRDKRVACTPKYSVVVLTLRSMAGPPQTRRHSSEDASDFSTTRLFLLFRTIAF